MVKATLGVIGFFAALALADYVGSNLPPAVGVILLLGVIGFCVYLIAKIGKAYNG